MLHEFDLLEATHKYEKERLTWIVNDQSKPFYNRPWPRPLIRCCTLPELMGGKLVPAIIVRSGRSDEQG